MNNYRAVIEYDGTDYSGFQVQKEEVRTVQMEIQKALEKLLPGTTRFSYAGRTDAGVHAKNQVIGFDTSSDPDLYRFKWQFNCIVPDDIVMKSVDKTEGFFDARREAVSRKYCYYVVNNNHCSVFIKRYSIMVTTEMDFGLMAKASELFIGSHDFAAFSNEKEKETFTIREIKDISLKKYDEGLIKFSIEANSFLYNMVRKIMGTLIEIGQGKRNIDSIEEAFRTGEKGLTAKAAPAKGLFLESVRY